LICSTTSLCKIEKKAAIVIDADSKSVLFSENPDARRHPASLTKIMTVYILLEAIKNRKVTFSTKFKVSKLASQQIPSKIGLKIGEKIAVLDIIKALTVKSANDAAVVAAEGLSGNVANFCRLMNQKAIKLGMRNTHFENPAGIPNSKQISTARDLAKLGMAVYRDFPQYWHLFSLKSFQYNKIKHDTHCKILHWYKGADGGKTGYVCASGFNLFVTASKYNKSGEKKRLFVVVMGRDSSKIRDLYAAQLMDKYLKSFTISSQQPNIKVAKDKLMEQVSKSEMLDQVIHEEEEILVSDVIKSKNVSKQYLDELYKVEEEVIEAEEEFLVKPAKVKKKLKNK
jgi:D-alanyl-D-alanine carboxypeptidase